jgi:mannose-6-phosphate isomerase-like protein (cupin superfamily)
VPVSSERDNQLHFFLWSVRAHMSLSLHGLAVELPTSKGELMQPQLVYGTGGDHVRFGKALGTRRVIASLATKGAFGLVEHDLPALQLGSPIHTHEREDEYSFVLHGRLSAQVGDAVLEAGPGEVLAKPRGIPHAFWNAGTEPVRFLELITPGGFEDYFFELAGPINSRDLEGMQRIRERYRLSVRPESSLELLERYGLQPAF